MKQETEDANTSDRRRHEVHVPQCATVCNWAKTSQAHTKENYIQMSLKIKYRKKNAKSY